MANSIRFLVIFLACIWLGFAIEILTWVQVHFVKPYINGVAGVCGALIKLFGGDAVVAGPIIRSQSNGFAVEIGNDCSGLEVLILLGAAVMAYRAASYSQKLVGFLACSLAIVVINTVRVITLFYLGQYSQSIFDWAHLYIWDVLIIIDGIVVYILWIKWVLRSMQVKDAPQ